MLVSEKAIVSQPSWEPDGRAVVYTSTRTGSPQVYWSILKRPPDVTPLTATSTGFFNPEVSSDGQWLAGLDFRYDGYHVGYAARPASVPAASALLAEKVTGPRDACTTCRMRVRAVPLLDTAGLPPAHNYSAIRSLLPTYWEPIVTQYTDNGSTFGAATSGYDAIGRHSYYLEAAYNTKFSDVEGYGAYQYAGLGQPFLNFTAEQSWEHFGIQDEDRVRLGDLDRRARVIGLSATFTRPRARTFGSFVVGGDLESRSYSTDPDSLLAILPGRFGRTRNFPSVFAGASWSNTRRPGLSISREDGVALSATARQRWETGDFSSAGRSLVGVSALYKSLDLPGFAHHVIAFRGAGGIADAGSITTFSVGGLSGGSLSVLEGIDLGGERRTCGVRGFSPTEESGSRARAA
jgi:hypothetical protein